MTQKTRVKSGFIVVLVGCLPCAGIRPTTQVCKKADGPDFRPARPPRTTHSNPHCRWSGAADTRLFTHGTLRFCNLTTGIDYLRGTGRTVTITGDNERKWSNTRNQAEATGARP